MIKVGTVCTGIGAPEMAMKDKNIPHKIIFASEIDLFARKTYLSNFGPEIMINDMTKEKWNDSNFNVDLLIGGIPCQSFSLAGDRLGELDKRGLLIYDFYRIVEQQQPKVFIIENVKGLLSNNNGITFQNWLWLFGRSVNKQEQMFPHHLSLEYNLHWSVLNAVDFGTPQNRERVFLVGIRKDLCNDFYFPKGFKLEKRIKDVLENQVDEKYFISERALKRLTNNNFGFHSDIKCGDDIASTILASEFKLARGMNLIKIEPHFLDGSDICKTIRTGGKSSLTKKHDWDSIIIPTENGKSRIRRLTPLECFRLQGFPDNYIKPCSDSQLYKQAGNSMHTGTIGSIIKNLEHIIGS